MHKNVTEAHTFESVRAEFPVVSQYAYLDHANVGPLPSTAVEAITKTLTAQARTGSIYHATLHDIAEKARGQFAALVSAAPSQIAYVPSTASGVSIVSQGLDWREGDEVIVPAIDYPSAVLPWVVLKGKGVVVRRVPCQRGVVAVEELLAACNSRTRVISTSWVQFSSGYRLDLGKLGEECHKRGIVLVVDGMQGVGALDINVNTLPIDALVTQSYKWLLGPQGVGWLYLSERLFNMTGLSAAGVRTNVPRESYFDHRLEPRPDVARFETGILNFHGIAGAMASQEMIMEIGVPNVEARVLELADRLRAGLLAIGCELSGTGSGRDRSQIVVFRHPRKSAQECHEHLLQKGIVTSVREGCVRASPHFYNSHAEIDQMVRLLS